ncbi:TPA: rod shape-determining protein [Patescibacteria group bacterium]|nr:rod shape-determining protein [Patescibacteria group bacterium]HCI04488.1 rod shape-determining protein [Patescibacteria group bacterium]
MKFKNFKIFGKFKRMLLSGGIGIDLGTANTLVYVEGEGIVINEPSVVAINEKTGQVVAIGNEAKRMLGRTPAHIKAIRPLVDGVVSDYEVTQEMLAYFIKKVTKSSRGIFARPRVVIGVPSGITNVEVRAVRDAAKSAGAGEVMIVEEPMAAAVGVRLPVHEPVGNMIIDIGGGTTDIAVISLSGIVSSKNMRVAGDKLNQDIIQYVRDEFKILLGEKTAEDLKIAVGSVIKKGEGLEAAVRGRDLITGLPREVVITDSDVREAIIKSIESLVDATKEVLEETPPELVSDIMHRGIIMAGGGAFLRGLSKMFESELGIPVYVAEDPLTAVVRGTGIILEEIENLGDILLDHEEAIPPK